MTLEWIGKRELLENRHITTTLPQLMEQKSNN